MKLLSSCIAITLILSSMHTSAQSSSFEGASVGFNITLDSPTTEFTTGSDKLNGMGSTSVGSGPQGAYGWVAGPLAVVSIGATYRLNDTSSGDFTSTAGFASLKMRDSYSVYVEPGFKVTDRTLVYAKLGYESANMQLDSYGGNVSRDINGASLGFGLRTLVNEHMYLQAEVKQLIFNSTSFAGQSSDFKTSATEGRIGVGYQF